MRLEIRKVYRFIQIHEDVLRSPIVNPILGRFLVRAYCPKWSVKGNSFQRTWYNIWDVLVGEVLLRG